MRYVSRVERSGSNSNFIALHADRTVSQDESGLSAFRGLLVAASVSAVFWGACLTVIWLLRSRN